MSYVSLPPRCKLDDTLGFGQRKPRLDMETRGVGEAAQMGKNRLSYTTGSQIRLPFSGIAQL
jgi:hypothetical protein